MVRILLADDSPAVRNLLSRRLGDEGYEVEGAPDGMAAAEIALRLAPDAVVTDMWMPGISGVQLCRLLRGEPSTRDVPVILVTADAGRRTKFWARCAGATACVGKADLEGLLGALASLPPTAERPTRPPGAPATHARVYERLSGRLDAALFQSVVAGEVRALALGDGEAETVFRGLARLASDVLAYRWLALLEPGGRALLHAHDRSLEACEAEARAALRLGADAEVVPLLDEAPLLGPAAEPIVAPVTLRSSVVATIAVGPVAPGASNEDRELVSLLATELAGPLRVVALVDQSRRLALIDPLTGLLNRRAFSEAMNRELARAARHGLPLSALLLDVDHFKRVNDTYGHDAGDAVLKGVAATVNGIARKSDQVGRWGGEEFVVGLAHSAEAGARIAAERVRRGIAEAVFSAPGGKVLRVTASIGAVTVGPGESLDALIARADRAMYVAKDRGRNRVEAG